MIKFDHRIVIVLLIISLIYPFFSTQMTKLHYIPTLIFLVYGLFISFIPCHRQKKLQVTYYLSRTAFLILLALSVLYIFRGNSLNLNTSRNIREQIVYMGLYGYIFVFIAIMIKYNAVYHAKLAKIITIYLSTFYIFFNVFYIITNGKVAHNASYACIGMILFSNSLYKLLYMKQSTRKYMFTLIESVLLFSMPILAFLRGATFTTIIILILQILFLSRNRARSFFMILIMGSIIVWIFSSDYISGYFKEENPYEYESQIEMSQALTSNDSNKDVRLMWWGNAIKASISSPVIGYAYRYDFLSFNNANMSAAGLHNYFISMIVDTGYITFLLYLIILLMATINGIKRIKAGDSECIKYISWNIALISTYGTNCFGHVWRASAIMGLLHAYAIVKLLSPSRKLSK